MKDKKYAAFNDYGPDCGVVVFDSYEEAKEWHDYMAKGMHEGSSVKVYIAEILHESSPGESEVKS